eukprot:589518-Rhodomonas_salina.1
MDVVVVWRAGSAIWWLQPGVLQYTSDEIAAGHATASTGVISTLFGSSVGCLQHRMAVVDPVCRCTFTHVWKEFEEGRGDVDEKECRAKRAR